MERARGGGRQWRGQGGGIAESKVGGGEVGVGRGRVWMLKERGAGWVSIMEIGKEGGQAWRGEGEGWFGSGEGKGCLGTETGREVCVVRHDVVMHALSAHTHI